MDISTVAIPVTCPICGMVTMTEFPSLVVATALIKWNNMCLYSACHEGSWDASQVEMDGVRIFLGTLWLDTHRQQLLADPLLTMLTREQHIDECPASEPDLEKGGRSHLGGRRIFDDPTAMDFRDRAPSRSIN